MTRRFVSPARRLVVAARVVRLLAGCQSMGDAKTEPAIVAVVDDFVGNVAADGRIDGFSRARTSRASSASLSSRSAPGRVGRATYTGRDLQSAHRGMNITDAPFNALVEDLAKSLDQFKVADREKGALLGLLRLMKAAIVGQ